MRKYINSKKNLLWRGTFNNDAIKVQLFATKLTPLDNRLMIAFNVWHDLFRSRLFVAVKKQFNVMDNIKREMMFLLENFPSEELTDIAAKKQFLYIKEMRIVKFVSIQQMAMYNLKHEAAFNHWEHTNNNNSLEEFLVARQELNHYVNKVSQLELEDVVVTIFTFMGENSKLSS